MPTIKAKIGGTWVPIGGGGDEVWVGADTPTDNNVELWYDTDEPNLYDQYDARWNSAWGVVGQATTNTPQSGIGATKVDLTSIAVTFVPVSGRRYRAYFQSHFYANGAGVLDVDITDGANTAVAKFNGQVAAGWVPSPVVITHAMSPPAGAAYTLKVRCSISASTVNSSPTGDNLTRLVVEDVGPVSLSAPPAQPASVWTNVTYLNGWSGESGGGSQPVQYRLVGDKVEVRGQAIRSAMAAAPVFNLPVGFRPPLSVRFMLGVHVTGAGGVYHTRTDVTTAGDVFVSDVSPALSGGATLYCSNISFSVSS